jgi:cycloeucalenol cycloisomerase
MALAPEIFPAQESVYNIMVNIFCVLQFPYYEFIDRDVMYKVGSLFYAIYFIVSFPMFSR